MPNKFTSKGDNMAQAKQKRTAKRDGQPVGFKLAFDIERETKNTFRYQERTEDDPVIGYLYMAKEHLETINTPDVLTVTIVPGE